MQYFRISFVSPVILSWTAPLSGSLTLCRLRGFQRCFRFYVRMNHFSFPLVRKSRFLSWNLSPVRNRLLCFRFPSRISGYLLYCCLFCFVWFLPNRHLWKRLFHSGCCSGFCFRKKMTTTWSCNGTLSFRYRRTWFPFP